MLNVVLSQRAFILQLHAQKDESLLRGRDSLHFFDLLLEIRNLVGRIDAQNNRLARQRLHLWSRSRMEDGTKKGTASGG